MRQESKVLAVVVAPPRPLALSDLITAYLSELTEHGYRAKTIDQYGRSLRRFAEYVQNRRCALERLADQIKPFIVRLRSRGHGRRGWRSVLGRFEAWLHQRGHVARHGGYHR